jgi:hypothetical protein
MVLTDEMRERIAKVFRTAVDQQVEEIKSGKTQYTEEDILRLRERLLDISLQCFTT